MFDINVQHRRRTVGSSRGRILRRDAEDSRKVVIGQGNTWFSLRASGVPGVLLGGRNFGSSGEFWGRNWTLMKRVVFRGMPPIRLWEKRLRLSLHALA